MGGQDSNMMYDCAIFILIDNAFEIRLGPNWDTVWKAVPTIDTCRGIKFATTAQPLMLNIISIIITKQHQ